MDRIRILRRIGLDIALWYLAPTLFLIAYVHLYSAPTKAVAPHLLVVGIPFVCGVLTRVTLARAIANELVVRLASAVVVATLLVLTLTYYTVVLIGLHSWGGVVAWNVIPTIFVQAPQLLDMLAIPPAAVTALLVPIYAGVSGLCWLYLRRFEWVSFAVQGTSAWTVTTAVLCGAAIVATEAYQFSAALWRDTAEPVSLTAFPLEQELEGHTIDPLIAANVDRREDEARRQYVPALPTHRKNIILIVVDALRPDHMGIFGYERDTTPYLRQLARSGALHAIVAHASCGDTICGLLSLASSKFPRGFSFRPFTLHEVLRRNGYRLHLILSGDHSHFYSLKNYYGKVDTFFDGTQAQGYFLNDDQFLIDHVTAMADWDGQPAMFQFHVMSSHVLRKRDGTPGRFQPAERYLLRTSHDAGAAAVHVESAINFYDNGVLQTDTIIHRLLQALERKGYLRDALVVITADHGESLGEHGLFQHANSVREQVLRIPLVLIAYGNPIGPEIDARKFASQVDIAPTILAEIGLSCPSTWAGRPLQANPEADFTYFEEHSDVGLIDHRDPRNTWKFWINTRSGEQHAFNLTVDPDEQSDTANSLPTAQLGAWRARALSGTSSPLAAP